MFILNPSHASPAFHRTFHFFPTALPCPVFPHCRFCSHRCAPCKRLAVKGQATQSKLSKDRPFKRPFSRSEPPMFDCSSARCVSANADTRLATLLPPQIPRDQRARAEGSDQRQLQPFDLIAMKRRCHRCVPPCLDQPVASLELPIADQVSKNAAQDLKSKESALQSMFPL